MGVESPDRVGPHPGAVFISYASQDSEAAQKICDALRAADIEVWFDKSELRGGDVWDRLIREQIQHCRLFIPVISANAEARDEGYFRREWCIAADRTRDMAEKRAFLIPVVVDDTPERGASVPDKFHQIQWTRLPGGVTPPEFVARVRALLGSAPPNTSPNSGGPTLAAAPPEQPRNRRALGITLGFTALAIVIAASWYTVQQSGLHRQVGANVAGHSPPAPAEKSIAVLPFVDLSETHDQEYFADGMAEEVLDLLAKIPSLRVIARTSSFQFKGKSEDLREVGRKLGCTYVLEGSVRKAAGRLRVTAQLIDTRDGAHQWSESYDRDAADVLKVQSEIALALVRALQFEVSSSGYTASGAPIRNQEAYDAYLRGLHAQERFDESGFEEAIADFRHALELDPSFVSAAEALAFALRNQADWEFVVPQVGWEQTRAAATHAITLNPQSALAHAILGDVHTEYDWDWSAAERELRTALSLAPRDPRVLLCAGVRNLAVGQWPEAVRLFDAELSADPLDPSAHAFRAWAYLRLGRFAEAESDQRQLLEFSPTFGWAHYYLGIALLQEGRAGEALAEMQKEAPASGQIAGLAAAYYALNRTREADAALARLKAEHATDWALMIAETYAVRRESDRALEWLDRAYAQKDGALYYVKGDPLLRNLEGDPRYQAFLRKMKLPE